VLPDFSIAHPAGVGVTSIKPIDLFTAFLVVIHAAHPAQEPSRRSASDAPPAVYYRPPPPDTVKKTGKARAKYPDASTKACSKTSCAARPAY
jgi:hypothetical protein